MKVTAVSVRAFKNGLVYGACKILVIRLGCDPGKESSILSSHPNKKKKNENAKRNGER